MINVNIKAIIGLILIIVAVIAVSLGVYYVKRKINYSMGYSDMVEGTVRRMVKKECLQ